GGAILVVCLAGNVATAQKAPVVGPTAPARPVASHPQPAQRPATATAPDFNATVKRYCVGCHSETGKAKDGDLSVASFDVTHAAQNAEVAEKMIRKLQAGFMPPPSMPRPDA